MFVLGRRRLDLYLLATLIQNPTPDIGFLSGNASTYITAIDPSGQFHATTP
jgi:hypothetical protein